MRTLPIALALTLAGAWVALPLRAANAADQVARGKYLVGLMSCTDCHTPGHFLGKEDATKFLGGSDVGFADSGPRRFRRSESDAG